MRPPARMLSLGEKVAERAAQRVTTWEKREASIEDGWHRLHIEDKATKVTFDCPHVDEARVPAILNATARDGLAYLFERVFTWELIENKLKRMKDDNMPG